MNPRGRRRHLLGGRLRVMVGAVLVAGTVALGAGPVLATRPPDVSRPTVSRPTTIVVEKTTSWGAILALSNGWAVYRFAPRPLSKSTCVGECAKYWPPVLLAPGQQDPVGRGVGHLGTITRAGGARQVTYEGVPLYRAAGGTEVGQVKGNIKDSFGQWWVVDPAHPRSVPVPGGATAPTTSTTFPFSGVAY
jgi:predicted lipoprotein with Yx(FWY)xxD motif